MKNYYRLMLGKGGVHATECFDGGYVGAGFFGKRDLTGQLPDQWRDFNKEFIPIYLQEHPDKTKIAAGLACGMLWTVAKGMNVGDILLCPDGSGRYRVGEISGPYYYAPDKHLEHRRPVRWFDKWIDRAEMSESLRNSAGSIGTVSTITSYADEIAQLIGDVALPKIITTDENIEDPATFAMESHLEDFLVQNWAQTVFGKEFEIVTDEDGAPAGKQFETDTGRIDILASSKDHKSLLVIELKRGRASDVVVGQILRYMGYVQDVLATENQQVRGVIIALHDDPKLKRALMMVPAVEFYRYAVSFKLMKS